MINGYAFYHFVAIVPVCLCVAVVHPTVNMQFLNQARASRRAPGFLKLFLCERLYARVCVCVSTPEAINN